MATKLYELRRRVRDRLLEPYVLVTPGAPLVSPQGTPGIVAYSYVVVASNATGTSKGSAQGVTATGAAVLDGVNFNQLTWIPVPGAAGYNVYRISSTGTPSSVGVLGTTTDTTFDDIGLEGDATTPPLINTSGIESPYWNDEDLTLMMIDGCKDLWRAIIDLHKNHFATVDTTNCSILSGTSQIDGVPLDCFRILSIEPRDITQSGEFRNIGFYPKPYQSAAFQGKRSLGTAYQGDWEFYYDLLNAGSPVGAPTIMIAPAPSSTLLLRVIYVHTLPALTEASDNPIPGESDNALIAWTLAFALARQRDDGMPDPAWLSIYATDKQSLLTGLTPRQEQEPEYVEGLFEGWW